MIAELVPWVEAAEGREFLTVPAVDIGSRATVNQRLSLDASRLGERSGREAPDWAREYDEALAEASLAIYTHGEEKIYLVKEAFEQLFEENEGWEVELEPLLRCVLVHELTHALQHQYSPWITDDGTSTPLASLALVEGHAELAALEYCQEQSPETAGYFTSLSAPAMLTYGPTPADRSTLIYGYGLEVIRELQEVGGREAVWAALHAPPDFELLREVVEPGAIEGWSDPDLLRDLSGELVRGDGWEVVAEVGSPAEVQPLFEGSGDAPRALAGHGLFAQTKGRSVVMLAFMLESEEEALALLDRRRTSIRSARLDMNADVYFLGEVAVLNPSSLRTKPLRKLAREEGILDTLRLEIGDYHEYWFVDGAMVVGGFFDRMSMDQRGFMALAEDLRGRVITTPPPPREPPPAVADWLAAMAAAGETNEPRVSWQYRLDQYADRLEAGDASACQEAGELALRDVPEDRRGEVSSAVHACAVMTGNLTTADTMLAQLGPDQAIDEIAGHNHVLLLRDAFRPSDALSLIERLPDATSPELAFSLRTLRMVLLSEAGRLPEAAAMATAADVAPDARAYIASQLAEAGQRDEALDILNDTCPRLSGGLRLQCDGLLEQLSL